MNKTSKKIPSYQELLKLEPNMLIVRASTRYREATEEATQVNWERGRLIVANFLKFLQENKLTNGLVYPAPLAIPLGFEIRLPHLTEEGFEFFKKSYDKWVRKFDTNVNADPSEIKVLEKTLKQMREEAQKDAP